MCVQSRSRDPYPCMDGRCLASYISSIKFKSREFSPPSSLPPSRDPQENITRTSYSFIRVKQHTSLTNSRGLGRHEHHEPNSLRQEIVLKRSFGNFICLDCRQYIRQKNYSGGTRVERLACSTTFGNEFKFDTKFWNVSKSSETSKICCTICIPENILKLVRNF